MCGIVALYHKEENAVDQQVLLAMRDAMIHRGPDDAGLYLHGNVGLAHRRLSIIDLSSSAHQPMCDASGSFWLVFNGEIYNFLQLRDEMSSGGYRFKTRSDTEVILALYAFMGERFVERLNGIFAFALWDSQNRKLFLVRDRMGVKPLYIWSGKNFVAAASEIKALMVHPDIQRDVNTEAIPEYLAYRQLAGNKTMFKGVELLGPGQMMAIHGAGETTTTYWRLPRISRDENRAKKDYIEQSDQLLHEATKMQLVADVPVGVFNSGGIDSSLITSYVAEEVSTNLNTFSVGFSDPRLDERPYAEIVARKYRTHHRSVVVDDEAYAENLPRTIWHHDEPLSHPHTVQLYLLSKLAKQFVTVVLTGEGSDELFAGYPRYRSGAALQLLGNSGQWMARNVIRWLPSQLGRRFGKARAALQLGPLGNVMEAARWVTDDELKPILRLHDSPISTERWPGLPLNGDLVARMLEQDQRNYLQALLMRLDKTSMAAGLEARVPFLDHRLIEFAATVPSSLKLRWGETKYLVKRLAIRRLPREIVYRRKMGFQVPLTAWLRNPAGLGRFMDMLLEPRSLQRGYLDSRGVRRLVQDHRDRGGDHTEILWGLINLELWQRIMIEERFKPEIIANNESRDNY